MSARELRLYRAGLVDAVRHEPSLDLILKIVGVPSLVTAYIDGWLQGRELLVEE